MSPDLPVLRAKVWPARLGRLVTVVDFPCAIAECCDVQLDYSIRNNEVQSCLRFKHVHARTCIQRVNVPVPCRFITAYFPRDNMCYVTANEIPRAHVQ